MKKVKFFQPPWKEGEGQRCECCDVFIEEEDECYAHGQGIFTCSKGCADKFEK